MISKSRQEELRNLAAAYAKKIKGSRQADYLAGVTDAIEKELESLRLPAEEMEFLILETHYAIVPGARPNPTGRRMILDHDVSAFLRVVQELRSRLAPTKQQKK